MTAYVDVRADTTVIESAFRFAVGLNTTRATRWLQRVGLDLQGPGVVGVPLALWGTLLPWAIQPSYHCQKGISKRYFVYVLWGLRPLTGNIRLISFVCPF